MIKGIYAIAWTAAFAVICWAPVVGAEESERTPILDITTGGHCGEQGGVDALRDELSLRLPDLRFAEEASHDDWHLFWLPRSDERCELVLRTSTGRMTLTLEAEPGDEDLRFAASRVSWLISADDEQERAELFEEFDDSDDDLPDIELDQLRDATRAKAQALAEAIAARQRDALGERARIDEAYEQARRAGSGAGDAVATVAGDARQSIEAAAPPPRPTPPPPRPFAQPSGGARITLAPGLVLSGQHHQVPNLSINFIGQSQAFSGLEVGLINHISWYGSGVQIGLLSNHVSGPFHGYQTAALVNRAGTLKGMQSGAAFNTVRRGSGVQFATFINQAGSFSGLQWAPINLGGEVRGVQLGLINISRSAWAPVGLISIARDYPPRIWTWYGAPSHSYVGVRAGGKYLRYGFVVGHRLGITSEGGTTIGANLGVHIPGDPLFVDVDLVAMNTPGYILPLSQSSVESVRQLRATAGWRFYPRFALIGGVSLSARSAQGSPTYDSALSIEGAGLRMWPELVLGLVF